MNNIHLVGLGSLGSTLAVEIAKRATSLDIPISLVLHDFDTVEDRNIAAQQFAPSDIGKTKVQAVADMLAAYPNVQVRVSTRKLDEFNIDSLIPADEPSIIVDCVDNLKARHLLWEKGTKEEFPVLHLGMSQQGTGNVSWNFREVDTFPLSPTRMSKKMLEKLENANRGPQTLPPCELNALRGLILCTCQAGLNALFTFLGFDICNDLDVITTPAHDLRYLTSWETDKRSFTPQLESINSEGWDY